MDQPHQNTKEEAIATSTTPSSKRTTFLTLPLEIRQAILFLTFDASTPYLDNLLGALNKDKKAYGTSMYKVYLGNDIYWYTREATKQRDELMEVHAQVSDDMEYVFGAWMKEMQKYRKAPEKDIQE